MFSAHRVSQVAKSETWRRKSRKRRPGFATVRHKQGVLLDTDQVVDDLLQDPDFVDQGRVEQAEEIRVLPTTLSNKMLIRYGVFST